MNFHQVSPDCSLAPRTRAPDAGVFTLSLDCEGLWGMADSEAVFADGRINKETLDEAYRFIAKELDRNSVRSTAAFVSCFAAEREAVRSSLHMIDEIAEQVPAWFRQVLPRLKEGSGAALSGLEGHEYWKRFRQYGHEMAWHGATHLPLAPETSREAVRSELNLAASLGGSLGGLAKTVIYPRNQIGHMDALRGAGFKTYRDSKAGGFSKRVTGLLREWSVWDKGDSEMPRMDGPWRVSPAGHFLNWPSGVRKTVPVAVTVQRWRSMLRHAAEHGRYVHMWFHPHNLITAPDMRIAFAQILAEVRTLQAQGDLRVLTIAEANGYFKL